MIADHIASLDGVYMVSYDGASRDSYRDGSALYNITFKGTGTDQISKDAMEEIGVKTIPSGTVSTVEGALEVASRIGYPVIIRPAFTLGGEGGGVARVHRAVARPHRKEGADIHEDKHQDGHQHRQQVKRNLSPPCPHNPWSFMK